MLIRVMYKNSKKHDMVKDFILDKLITSGKVAEFYRSGRWAVIGRDPIRKTVRRVALQDTSQIPVKVFENIRI